MQATMRAAVLLGCWMAGCRSTSVAPHEGDVQAIRATLDELYRAFGFDAGGAADWDTMEELFIDGAAFVAPIAQGREVRAVGTEQFLGEFQAYVASDEARTTGLHERILHARIDLFGTIAHAFVAFEGFAPGTREVLTRGLDSLQLVRARDEWRVVSFTTQYASVGQPLPERFLAPNSN